MLGRIVGALLTLGGGTFSIMAIADLVSGHERGVAAAMLFFFGGITFGGVRLLKPGAPKPALPEKTREHMALKMAQRNNGLIGVAQLAASGGIPFAEAQATLEALSRQGACETVVTEGGAVLYRFPDLVALAEGAPPKLLE